MSGCKYTPGPEEEMETAPITKYISCIHIHGQPILPPVMTPARREEMQLYRVKAEQLEKKLKSRVKHPKLNTQRCNDTKETKQEDAGNSIYPLKRVTTHEILEEFDPFSPRAFPETEAAAKCRYSGSSDEFATSKTDSSNNSVALTNSTDLNHYMDISGSTQGDGRSTRRSFTPASTPGTATGGDWNSPPSKMKLSIDSNSSSDEVKTTYEGLNEYLDSILNCNGPTPSDRTEKGHFGDSPVEETTPTNPEVQPLEARKSPFTDFQDQVNRLQSNRPASCPLSPTPQESLLDSAIGSLSGPTDSIESPVREACVEEKLIDLANDQTACGKKKLERKVAQPNTDTVPRLVRSNSYTLDSPSPMLLALIEAERKKAQSAKAFNTKQPIKNVAGTFRNKNPVEKTKNGIVPLRKTETQVMVPLVRKDNNKRICHSPPAKVTNPVPVVTQSASSTNDSLKSNRNRFTPNLKLPKVTTPPITNVPKTPPSKTLCQKDCTNDVPTLQDTNLVLSDQVQKLFMDLQAEHNRQMEELLSRQRKEQELIRLAILQQKGLLTSDPGVLATQLSEAGSGENYTWASLLRTNPAAASGNCSTDHNIAPSTDQLFQLKETQNATSLCRDDNEAEREEGISRKSVSVIKSFHVNENPNSAIQETEPRSASGELIQIEKETYSVSRSRSSNLVFSQLSNNPTMASFKGNTLHRASSMSEICTDQLQPERNQLSNGDDANRERPSSSPAFREPPVEDFSRAFSAYDNLISEDRIGTLHQLPRSDDLSTSLVSQMSSKEMLANPFRDANGNISQTNDLNCRNLLVSPDSNKNAAIPSPAVHQVRREISLEDGVLTCYAKIASTEVFSVVGGDRLSSEPEPIEREHSPIIAPTVQISPRGRRRAWNSRQAHSEGRSLMIGDPEWLELSRERQRHWAATKIQAATRGYLTRRLLRTERVQNCITVIHDTILCALQLQKECGRNVEPSDLQLHGRLIHQLSDACREIHSIFIELPIAKRMAIISVDRERLLTRTPRSPKSNGPRPLSRATQLVLNRKMMQNSQSHSRASLPAGRRRNWANVDSPRNSRPSTTTLTQDPNETFPVCLVRSASLPANETQRFSSAGHTRKPWR